MIISSLGMQINTLYTAQMASIQRDRLRLARQVQRTNLLLQCGQAARENSQWNVAVIDSHENKVRTIKIYKIRKQLRPAAFCLRRQRQRQGRSRQRRDAATIMSSRNGKNQPQLSPANVGHVAEAKRKADNREREGEGQCSARVALSLFVLLLCAARSLQYRFVFFCGAALHGHLLRTTRCIHLGARSLALFLFAPLPLAATHTPLPLALSHSLRAAAVLLMRHFFKLRPFPVPFLPSLSRSRLCSQPVATTTTTTMKCPYSCCCSRSCCSSALQHFTQPSKTKIVCGLSFSLRRSMRCSLPLSLCFALRCSPFMLCLLLLYQPLWHRHASSYLLRWSWREQSSCHCC